ncbi:hypothetical protein K2173_025776 [Erythroxylum novogranatense]|uniref:Tetraspanin n=1 Tax=Erythroxylum novogranatense TaxID=1862640 RepID=A0AAV8SHC3_9ROSI|nr:hypothetical protein K2173_025776 [Erythroxylum novogranatense]
MTRCARCCLHRSTRIMNLIMLIFGTAMIVYSLWLQKRWSESLALLPSGSSLPRPWFIIGILGVGIAVCLSTIYGHMVTNCTSNSILCIYIIVICCLLIIEIAAVISIFFKIDWEAEITAYIDKNMKDLESFVIFQVKMCCWISLLTLAAQIYTVVLAITLCVVGLEPRGHCEQPFVPSFTQSFLVPNFPGPASSVHDRRRYENPVTSFLENVKRILRAQVQRRYVVY